MEEGCQCVLNTAFHALEMTSLFEEDLSLFAITILCTVDPLKCKVQKKKCL